MLNIKQATVAELAICLEILLDSKLGEVYFADPEKARRSIVAGFSTDEILIAQDAAGNYVGFLWYVPDGAFHAFPYLHIIAVKRDCRGKGYGKQLIRFLEDEILGNKGKLFLVVADFNPAAQRLYENLGFTQVGEIDGLYKEGVTERLMMKVMG